MSERKRKERKKKECKNWHWPCSSPPVLTLGKDDESFVHTPFLAPPGHPHPHPTSTYSTIYKPILTPPSSRPRFVSHRHTNCSRPNISCSLVFFFFLFLIHHSSIPVALNSLQLSAGDLGACLVLRVSKWRVALGASLAYLDWAGLVF